MIETPRTDAEEILHRIIIATPDTLEERMTRGSFSRQLERELSLKDQRIAELERERVTTDTMGIIAEETGKALLAATARAESLQAQLAEAHKLLERARNKLRQMSEEFGRTNFTDRYGDGPAMRAIADAIDAAIAAEEGK